MPLRRARGGRRSGTRRAVGDEADVGEHERDAAGEDLEERKVLIVVFALQAEGADRGVGGPERHDRALVIEPARLAVLERASRGRVQRFADLCGLQDALGCGGLDVPRGDVDPDRLGEGGDEGLLEAFERVLLGFGAVQPADGGEDLDAGAGGPGGGARSARARPSPAAASVERPLPAVTIVIRMRWSTEPA